MSENITTELQFFLYALYWGVILSVIYDGLRIFRKVFSHKELAIAVEDLCYWVFATFFFFWWLYQIGDGSMRPFALLAIALAMILYRCTISHFLVEKISFVLIKIKCLIRKINRFLYKPVGIAWEKQKRRNSRIKKKLKNLIYITKKRLTYLCKLLTITLCKR